MEFIFESMTFVWRCFYEIFRFLGFLQQISFKENSMLTTLFSVSISLKILEIFPNWSFNWKRKFSFTNYLKILETLISSWNRVQTVFLLALRHVRLDKNKKPQWLQKIVLKLFQHEMKYLFLFSPLNRFTLRKMELANLENIFIL